MIGDDGPMVMMVMASGSLGVYGLRSLRWSVECREVHGSVVSTSSAG